MFDFSYKHVLLAFISLFISIFSSILHFYLDNFMLYANI